MCYLAIRVILMSSNENRGKGHVGERQWHMGRSGRVCWYCSGACRCTGRGIGEGGAFGGKVGCGYCLGSYRFQGLAISVLQAELVPELWNFDKLGFNGEIKKERPEGEEPIIVQEPIPQLSIFYQPSKSFNLPFPSRLKKQKKDDEDERLLLIFKQIHINLPFLKAMIHMPNGAKVLKDLISHKEKLEKAAFLVKLSEECFAIIQRNLPQKEGDPGSFTLPCLIGPIAVKNALAELGMDEDDLVSIILGRPFLATVRAVIDVNEGKLSLRVGSETVTFNIGKSMKSKHSRDDYLYCADHTAKLVQEQWVNTVNHDVKWTEEEEKEDSNKVLAVSFYPRTEPVEPLKWNALENQLKPSSVEPPKLKLKELPELLEYAFLHENNQLPVVILSALSTVE
nr:hypothetical protein [Tanacetum cinerariifolium]